MLRGALPGEADIRGKGDRERTIFLDPAALKAIREYVEACGPGDSRRWVFVSHGNQRRRNDRLSPWSVWAIVKKLARDAEAADPAFLGLARALHTHDTRHHFASTMLNSGASLSVVQDLLGHTSPATTKRIYATSERAVLRAAAVPMLHNCQIADDNTAVQIRLGASCTDDDRSARLKRGYPNGSAPRVSRALFQPQSRGHEFWRPQQPQSSYAASDSET